MSGKILRFDDSTHRRVDAVLPWFVNGTLEDDELADVERHLRDCARCRREVGMLRELQGACAAAALTSDATPAYRRLSRRIGGRRGIDALVDPARRCFRQWRQAPVWARLAIGGQLAVIVAVFLWAAPPGSDSDGMYRTLGTPALRSTGVATIAVVFRPDTMESAMRRIVQATGGRVVDGPTESNAYVLQVPAGRGSEALAELRAAPDVVLAEPLTRQPGR